MTRLDLARQLVIAARLIAVRKTSKPAPTTTLEFPSDPASWMLRYRVLRARP